MRWYWLLFELLSDISCIFINSYIRTSYYHISHITSHIYLFSFKCKKKFKLKHLHPLQSKYKMYSVVIAKIQFGYNKSFVSCDCDTVSIEECNSWIPVSLFYISVDFYSVQNMEKYNYPVQNLRIWLFIRYA